MTPPLRLIPSRDRWDGNDALAARFEGRVGLAAVLNDLDHAAVRQVAPARAATYGFTWSRRDAEDTQWWPQGISTSSDAGPDGGQGARDVVVVTWYAKKLEGHPSRGVRLSVVDLTDPDAPRYRHVLLVTAARDKESGEASLQPVRIHAGGLVWRGSSIWVPDTSKGLRVFDLADIVRVGGPGWDGFDYLLPQRAAYTVETAEGERPFRFSFLSLTHGGSGEPDACTNGDLLVTGEYAREAPARLVGLCLNPDGDGLTVTGDAVVARDLVPDGPPRMQGAVQVEGTWYFATSRGRYRRGTLWTRSPDGRTRRHHASLAIGPEDLAYWRERDQIWSCSEYPGRRYAYAMPRQAFALDV